MKKWGILVFATLSMLLTTCVKNKTNSDDEIPVSKFEMKKGADLKNWHCYNIQNDEVCLPKDWKSHKKEEVIFYSDLGDSTNGTYFSISRYVKKNEDVSAKNYLRQMYDVLSSDTIEVTNEYKLSELNFSDFKAFFGEFYMNKKLNKYCYYTMIWETDGYLYGLAMKAKMDEREYYYKDFQNILYTFKSDGKLVFSEASTLKSIRNIDLQNL